MNNDINNVDRCKNKVKFSCKLCKEDRLTHQRSTIEESQILLVQWDS
jgi:hypothetical protein